MITVEIMRYHAKFDFKINVICDNSFQIPDSCLETNPHLGLSGSVLVVSSAVSGALLDTAASLFTTHGSSGEVDTASAALAPGVEPGTKRARRPPQPEQNVTEF